MKSIFLFSTLTFSLLISVGALAKRIAPEVINSVIHKGFEYTFEVVYTDCKDVSYQCAMQVFMLAKDIGAEKTAWRRELYKIKFNRDIETDVQTVFPRSLELEDGILKAFDERGTEFLVNAKDGKLKKPKKAIVYKNF